ncbi:uncharacterized protein LOC131843360 [Achroia grisella]|uniref:uncharacterized protein LOC131843360 n=1 Tax=Achroia grisella TaxID=688607 RepID=UPI0027D27B8E|nr:uncharacterized protein LOC131843360 [Achroia grisella]
MMREMVVDMFAMPVQRKLYCYFMFTLILCVHTNAKNETVKIECPIVQHGSGLMEDKDCNKDLAWSDTDYMEYDELLIVNNSKISNLGDLSDIHVVQKVAAKKSDTFDAIFSGVTDDDESSGSIPPPQVEDIINDLENMLNGTDPIHIEDVDQIFDQIEDLLSGETEAFPGELIQLLERLGSSVNLESSNSDMIVKSNIALMVADANSDYSVRGLTVSAEGQNFNDKELKFLNGNVTEDILDSNLNEVVVNLPESLLDGPKRISFLLFSDGNALPYDGELAINSRVVNVNIREPTRVMNGEVVDIHLKPSIVPERNRRRSCGYWEYLDDATGHWSQEGCTFISSQNSAQLDTCKCERIGHYAEILVALPSFSETDDNALRILSITEAKKSETVLCPIGFKITYNENSGHYVCYKRKLETFANIFKNCDGNLYSSKLYRSLNIDETEIDDDEPDGLDEVWAEYKSLYPGGPFISTALNKYEDTIIDNVTYYPDLDIYQETCLIVNKLGLFTAVGCDEKHYRYCIVKPYDVKEETNQTGCDQDYQLYQRFNSPIELCVFDVTNEKEEHIEATWKQSQKLCAKYGGALLSRGWQYSNFHLFNKTNASTPIYPLGMIWNRERKKHKHVADDNFEEKPDLVPVLNNNDIVFMAIQNETWKLINSSFIFNNIICERPIQQRNILMELINHTNQILLAVNNMDDVRNIYCYTDSETYYPTKVNILKDINNSSNSNIYYRLLLVNNGYYWCIHIDPDNFHVTETQKTLFLGDKKLLAKQYAIKIKLYNEYSLKDIEEIKTIWQEKFKRSISFRRRNVNKNGVESIKNTNLSKHLETDNLNLDDTSTISNIKLKRIYIDKRTVLFHVQISEDMIPFDIAKTEDAEVLSVKPVYYCDGLDVVTPLSTKLEMEIGDNFTSLIRCNTYKCVGNFNEGVSLVKEGNASDCVKSSSLIYELGNVEQFIAKKQNRTKTNAIGTRSSALTPEDEIDQVLHDLDVLLQDDGLCLAVMENQIDSTFDRVNNLLQIEGDFNIPSQLLHKLDNFSLRLNLNGNKTGEIVRNSIAVLIADAGPDNPIRGIKVAVRNSSMDFFTSDSFQFLVGEMNSTQLFTNNTDTVVYLPKSVTNSLHRIGFLVFLNERAFYTTNTDNTVNSNIISVNVENITAFENEEVIDIYLRPLVKDPGNSMSRKCSYWQFAENNTGYWSTKGCTYVKLTDPHTIDTCRCNHLTHFAEVLVTYNLKSNHDSVLEIISIVGCSLSIFGTLSIILTATMFRVWRKEYSNIIWLQLCVAIFLLKLCFIPIAVIDFKGHLISCLIVGITLHYALLATFCWMLVAAIVSYRRLVLVFAKDLSHKCLKASAFAWGFPFVIVGILVSVNWRNYTVYMEDVTLKRKFCYPSEYGLWFGLYLPVAAMLLANWILFFLIIQSVFLCKKVQRFGSSNEALRFAFVSCLLVFLFGLPWVFGFFAYNIVAAYFFVITATFEGFMLFIFIVLANRQTRDLWLNKLNIKQNQKMLLMSPNNNCGVMKQKQDLFCSSAANICARKVFNIDLPEI